MLRRDLLRILRQEVEKGLPDPGDAVGLAACKTLVHIAPEHRTRLIQLFPDSPVEIADAGKHKDQIPFFIQIQLLDSLSPDPLAVRSHDREGPVGELSASGLQHIRRSRQIHIRRLHIVLDAVPQRLRRLLRLAAV